MRLRQLATTAVILTLAGCGSAGSSGSAAHHPTMRGSASSAGASPGGSEHSASGTRRAQRPSATAAPAVDAADQRAARSAPTAAAMVCSKEIRTNLATLLDLPAPPTGRATWRDKLFTCRYQLPDGPLVMTVKQLADPPAARAYLARRRAAFAGARALNGLPSLGLPAFQNRSGVAAFAKDEFTLIVDARQMRAPLGTARMSRATFAYTVASDVLACWAQH